MKTIKVYKCDCGEDIYEDDKECCNCGHPREKEKLVDESLIKIVSEGKVDVVSMPFIKK